MKTKNSRTTKTALAAALLAAGGSAMAQQAGDWVFGAGWMHFAPQDSSKPLTLTSPVNQTVPGSSASVADSDTLGLSATYFLDSHWGVEGVVGVPPKFKLDGGGTLGPIGELGSARQWSPALLGKYYFNEGNAAFRPYVGLGLTYVWYSDVELTPGMQNAVGGLLRRPPGSTVTSAKLDSSWAPVFNIGAAYQFDPHWGVSFSVSYIPLKTTAKLTTTSAATGAQLATSEASLKVNPIVPFVAVTYRY
ncbi:OmpW family protein [Variovorax sp. OV329]|uniref:OmpW/AlkL family protein n=1 Tax=Variovorax sp. OV329 TaxID=1882825 RepID=UPI000B81CAD7|nr:OmpW family outer membrane protein [Variovorax sp. OV329]